MKNCPFYGYAMFVSTMDPRRTTPFILMASTGNQCALITSAHSPCCMERDNLPVEWSECPYVADIRLGDSE